MANHRKLVDDIRSLLHSLSAPEPVRLEALAAEQRALCSAANERLRECAGLLSRGLRSEAILQSEREPDLLNVVSVLDFPELPQWLDLLARHGIAGPPALMLETAAELNEAYAHEQPLKQLLRQQRRLALQRAPLAKRIDVLRQLAERDPQTLPFRQDLQEYETARIAQIAKEFAAAQQARDSAGLDRLQAELDKNWVITVSPDLRKAVGDANKLLQDRRSRRRMREIEPELNRAFASLDFERARQLQEEFQACAEAVDAGPDDSVVIRAGAALQWLAAEQQRLTQQMEREAALAELSQQVDEARSLDALVAAFERVAELEAELPAALDDRCRAVADRLRRQRRWRRRLSAVTLLSLTLACAGVAWQVVNHQLHAIALARHLDTVRKLRDENPTKADEYLVKIKSTEPEMAQEPEFRQWEAAVKRDIDDESKRRDAFQAALAAVLASGADQPDQAALAKATNLAKTEHEQQQIHELHTKIRAAQQRRQEKLDTEFANRLEDVSKQLAKLSTSMLPEAQCVADLRNLHVDIDRLVKQATLVSRPLSARLNQLKDELRQLDARLELAARQRSAELRITQAVGNPAQFAGELRSFVSAFPDSPQTPDFEAVLNEESLWKGLEAWNEQVAAWQQIDPTDLRPEQVDQWISRIKELSTAYPGFPPSAGFQTILAHLEAIARRKSSDAVGALKEQFLSPLISEAWMLTQQGDHFYSEQEPKKTLAGYSVRYWVGFDNNKTKAKIVDVDGAVVQRAPQSAAAEAVVKELSAFKDSDWEAAFARMISAILKQREMDPILKAFLLNLVLTPATAGSEPMRIAFEEHRVLLRGLELTVALPWMDPFDREAARAGVLALPVLQQFEATYREAEKRVERELQKFRRMQLPASRWVGWLCKTPDGKVDCRFNEEDLTDARLAVLVRGAKPEEPLLVTIGSLHGGRLALAAGYAKTCKPGRPVYVTLAAQPERSPARTADR